VVPQSVIVLLNDAAFALHVAFISQPGWPRIPRNLEIPTCNGDGAPRLLEKSLIARGCNFAAAGHRSCRKAAAYAFPKLGCGLSDGWWGRHSAGSSHVRAVVIQFVAGDESLPINFEKAQVEDKYRLRLLRAPTVTRAMPQGQDQPPSKGGYGNMFALTRVD